MNIDTLPGQSFPLGATVTPDGVNFSVFSKNCAAIELLLFDEADDPEPAAVIPLSPSINRTFYYWHVFVPGLQSGQLYGYRAYGPFAPKEGHRFDGWKVLLDPYARAVAGREHYDRTAAARPGDNGAHAMKSVVVDPGTYDWEDDTPLHHSFARTVIYELHVGGFTRHPSSGVAPDKRGTYLGLIEKIPYLKELGITAVELLPVQQFDEQDAPPGLVNYWGYSPVAFFAPHSGYAASRDPLAPVHEFRDLVKALHRAGIEVILDVVFNHTAEGNHEGPTLSFRGLENKAYYMLDDDPATYADYSGCGNTFNANHSIVRRLIMDCLRYWVAEMHVDGFRFDLASIMARGEFGRPLESPPILWDIESDPVLSGTKIIAEAWDATGLIQVGSFVGHRWAEWNSYYRDDVRRFLKGDEGTVHSLAQRIDGSLDLFQEPERDANRSINFITCHDGFTLNDLVSYNEKHNEANGENNQDGTDLNFSWNCGVEGPTDHPEVDRLRVRQIKNALTILLVSQGTPMLLMGDEVRRTQGGNNNAYCQDNEIGWFDWNDLERNADLLRFTRGLVDVNMSCEVFQEERFWSATAWYEESHITWHGVRLGHPDWSEHSHSLAFELHHPESKEHVYVALNAYWEPLAFELPALPSRQRWHRVVDTARPSPEDVSPLSEAPRVDKDKYAVEARSSVVLWAR